MKKKVISLKIVISLIGIMLLLNCEKEEIVQPVSPNQKYNGTIEFISVKTIPKVESLINQNIKNDFQKNKTIGRNFTILTDNILKITNTEGIINYTFSIEVNNPEKFTFYNLIINRDKNGQIGNPYIRKYTCTSDQYSTFKKNYFDIAYFKGTVTKYNLKDFSLDPKLLERNSTNCDPQDFNPSQGNFPTSGNNGGSGSQNNDTTQPVGNSYNGGSVFCTTYIHVNRCRAGGNHLPGESCNGQGSDRASITQVTSCTDGSVDVVVLMKNNSTTSPCPTENGDIGIITEDITYIKVANTLNLNKDQKDFLRKNTNIAIKIDKFLEKNNTDKAKNWTKEVIKTLMHNPEAEIDFEDQIINQLTEKAKCVYDKLKNNNLVKKTLQKFDGTNSLINLKLTMSNLKSGISGETKYGDIITIILDINEMKNTPSLWGAHTIIHEMIHADIYRKVYITGGILYTPPNTYTLNGSESDFPTLFNYYDNYPKNPHHNYMADYYRVAMKKALKEYATAIGKTYPDQLYKYLAWAGLEGTNAWDKMYADPVFTAIKQQKIKQAIINFKNSENNGCN
ncbi:hypothetical protein F7018_03440 [Tenacibaculum aiptasiae]|uniref:Uncharacterized protein n=1 Tax=Tenacibaculum aiptasiae TaxID=426481 RepID=A0A7J5AP36_9FLAO|nr:hypothetical protein [Tenacibaculum aiptasiae]KAB1159378.1 hypothetical protein F7018_03440 [Tenacibaculum aiptasiae]